MGRPFPSRWLAPLALAGALVAFVVVLSSGGGESSEESSTTAATTGSTATTITSTSTTPEPTTGPRFYTVQAGDVLSGIAAETGVPLDRIEELNPDVDAQTLRMGQRIRLRP